MNISRTDTCKTVALLRKSAEIIECLSIRDSHRNRARKCRLMADKLEKKLKREYFKL